MSAAWLLAAWLAMSRAGAGGVGSPRAVSSMLASERGVVLVIDVTSITVVQAGLTKNGLGLATEQMCPRALPGGAVGHELVVYGL